MGLFLLNKLFLKEKENEARCARIVASGMLLSLPKSIDKTKTLLRMMYVNLLKLFEHIFLIKAF